MLYRYYVNVQCTLGSVEVLNCLGVDMKTAKYHSGFGAWSLVKGVKWFNVLEAGRVRFMIRIPDLRYPA